MYKKSVMLVQSCCFAFKTFVVVVVDVLVAIISSDRKVPITKLHRKLGRNSPLKIAIRLNTDLFSNAPLEDRLLLTYLILVITRGWGAGARSIESQNALAPLLYFV